MLSQGQIFKELFVKIHPSIFVTSELRDKLSHLDCLATCTCEPKEELEISSDYSMRYTVQGSSYMLVI